VRPASGHYDCSTRARLRTRAGGSIGEPIEASAFTGDSHRADEGERLFEREIRVSFQNRRKRHNWTKSSRLESRPRDAPKRNRTIGPHSLHLARATMAALSSTVHISSAKALAPKAAKRAVAVKAAARADSNNEVRLPPENHRG
jgi:hypothetical protein